MKPRLLHPLAERHSARRRHRRGVTGAEAISASGEERILVAEAHAAIAAGRDADVVRVQEAGGPVDQASYGCACGYLFSADVSTSVTCPHCGAGQAW